MKLAQLHESVDEIIANVESMAVNGMLNVGEVLGKEVETALNYADMTQPQPSQLRTLSVPIKQLIPIQEDVEVDHVVAYINGQGRSGNEPILVVRDETGRLLIQDGHHRVVAFVVMGKTHISAQVAVVDHIDTDDDFNVLVIYKDQ